MLVRNKCLHPIALPFVSGSKIPIFRCGKCVNCLKHKASELVVRMVRQLQGRSLALITFTYDNEHCPVRRLQTFYDPETGEVFDERSGFLEDVQERLRFFSNAPFEWRTNSKGVPVKRFHPLVEHKLVLSGDYAGYVVDELDYQSVRYEDVKLCLKRFRRKYPDVLSDFICVPEYGGAGYRPHVHLLAIGLTREQCLDLADCWRERGRDHKDKQSGNIVRPQKLGNVDIQIVDSSDPAQVQKVSGYLAKYTCKGAYDCPYIRAGYCDKPRRSISECFGVGDLKDFLRLSGDLLRWDLYGHYDPKNISDEFAERINPDAIISHRVYYINGFPYPIPRYLLTKIFTHEYTGVISDLNEHQRLVCEPDINHKNFTSVYDNSKRIRKASTLQSKVADSLLRRAIDDVERTSKRIEDEFKSGVLFPNVISSFDDSSFLSRVENEFIRSIEQGSIY